MNNGGNNKKINQKSGGKKLAYVRQKPCKRRRCSRIKKRHKKGTNYCWDRRGFSAREENERSMALGLRNSGGGDYW